MPQPLPGPQYGRDFYENRDASTGAFADALARIAFDYFRPESVVDVGCGVGTLLRHMKERGAQRILGIEGPWAQHELLVIEPHELIIRELSGDVQIGGAPFDLACSLEVAEHLPPEREAGFVKLLCSLSDVVVFAAAVPGQGGVGHVNERWQSHWAGLFANEGYIVADLVRPLIWESTSIPRWYKQNTLVYVRGNRAEEMRESWPEHTSMSALDVVHPESYRHEIDRQHASWRPLSEVLGALPRLMRNAVVGRLRRFFG